LQFELVTPTSTVIQLERGMILPDNETRVDLLNNEAIANTIVTVLRAQHGHPVTIGVHGDWGAGKSSILEMIEGGLRGQRRCALPQVQ
jgi:putative protein kinase ArgK-like GTPase of G3E family